MIVHRYWQGPPSKLHAWTSNALKHFGHAINEVSSETVPAAAVRQIAETEHLVLPRDRPKHASNIIRWHLLYEQGGCWVDSDLILLQDPAKLPQPSTASHFGTRCTCFLSFPANHPDIKKIIDAIGTSRRRGTTYLSGEKLADSILSRDIPALTLPYTPLGDRVPGVYPWAIHLHNNHTGVA